MMKFTLVAAALVVLSVIGSASARPHGIPDGRSLTKASFTYEDYAKAMGRTGRDAKEHARRKALFNAELERVIAHNGNKDKTHWVGLNQFSDWTPEEKRRMFNKNYMSIKKAQAVKPTRTHVVRAGATRPYQVDWRTVSPPVLTAVKDQGQCGSCWAHASTETMESHWALATGQLSVLSQEQVTACTPNPSQCGGTGGCGGATHELAYDYVTAAGGLTEEWIYPYTSYFGKTGSCQTVNDEYFSRATFSGYVKVPTNDLGALMDALQVGPVAVTVQAEPWMSYEGGVFKGCPSGQNGTNVDLDHGVQLIGYGFDAGASANYWIIRNSWSPSWGEQGIIRLFRAATPQEEQCGWDRTPQDGVACKGDNNPEYVCGECGIGYDTSYPIPAPRS